MSVRIVSVTSRPSLRGPLYRIRDDQGQRYSTTNSWLANLCQRALETGQAVAIASAAGWYDRTIIAVRVPGETQTQATA